MKALTWHGKRDVRVDEVPDPTIEEPNDAIIRVTSSGICGSDLHLYEVLGPVHDRGRHPRPRADGHRRGGRARGHAHQAGRPRRHPVQHLLRQLLHVRPGPPVAVRDHAEPREARAPRSSATRSSTGRCRADRPSSSASRRPTTARSRCPRARRTTGSSTCPTSCRRLGRRSSTPASPTAGRSPCSASARSATWRCRVARQRGAAKVIGDRPRARAPDARAGRGIETLDLRARGRRPPRGGARGLTDGRGPDAVIDAVGMEAHGAPLGKLAQTMAGVPSRRDRGRR